MIKPIAFLGSLCMLTALHVQAQHEYPPQKPLWNIDELGTQRAVLRVESASKQVTASIPWRNRNVRADQKIILVDSATQQVFSPSHYGNISAVSGEFQFEPRSGKGIYYVYFLPYKLVGRSENYPDVAYLKQEDERNTWDKTVKARAKLVRIEAADTFNQNDAMDVISTPQEQTAFLKKHRKSSYFVFPEDRDHQIKMADDLPQRWTTGNVEGQTLRIKSDKGELLAFQLGLYSDKQDLQDIKISFSDLKSQNGNTIASGRINCINTDGVSYTGQPVKFNVTVPKQKVQALWCGIDVPKETVSAVYEGIITIKPANAAARNIPVRLEVSERSAVNQGYDEPWKLTRLNWLNSTLAQESTVIAPYIPLQIDGNEISLLGRSVSLDKNGFPAQIRTFFTQDMLSIGKQGNDLLTEAIHFHFRKNANQDVVFEYSPVKFDRKEQGLVSWSTTGNSSDLILNIKGSLEFDGFVDYTVQLIATKDIHLSDVQFHIPLQAQYAKYFMGLGEKGGYRKDVIDWKWDVANKNQDGGWIGNVNAGLQFAFRDQHYSRPLNTNFYLQKPLVLPASWGNENKGGIQVGQKGKSILVDSYSGERNMKAGDTLYYNFHLMITPFHTINTDWQWDNRFFHAYKPIEEVKRSGANVINIHHGNNLNPYINYPFVATREMKSYIDSAHREGLKVKIYNTVREVSNRMYEIYPLRSLGHEVFSSGKGGGYSWLQEHLNNDYIGAWYVPRFNDAAIINSGMNRWHNYYVEGMNWLVDHMGIDGIYLDDVAFDRVTMKRIKRVMTKNNHPGIIDLHSANQFNKSDGFNNSANLYMEHFPYINRLWFGEYFDYEKNDPDFFLTEVSGIPFGLMGEMLQDGGNPWRGMIYGMTNRYPWEKAKDTRDIWRVWDEFGIRQSRMIGYWVDNNPVKTDNNKILTTVYQKEGSTMIALASWAATDTKVNLLIDWKALGLDATKVSVTAPAIKNVQEAHVFKPGEQIPVEKGKGWLLLVK
ncbi:MULTISPECIES: glycoside hydrolase domain-containing protein [unclassified Sphingobacterium]|uniref:glycoside hydrolase domain-containing protein n=1 Tax=unclassified Sphingobacterium TaxID=2609468 RepID=UPI0025EA82F5|nr:MULTISPECIES: glycoside hydrolase domain-containing protein [unclassified Sphingobacterium]